MHRFFLSLPRGVLFKSEPWQAKSWRVRNSQGSLHQNPPWRFCRGMICNLLPFLVFKGKAQGGRLEEIIFPCVVQKLAPDAVYRQLIWKSERFMWFASLLLHHPWALDWLTMCGQLSDCFRAHSQTSRRESFGHIFAVCFWVEVTNLKPILNLVTSESLIK